ncbi:MAG: peptidyl-prolyl cis-trans isomerase [Chthonomonadales bacterium]
MKKTLTAGLLASAALISIVGCGGGKKIVAHVGSETILEDEFYSRVQQVNVANLSSSYQAHGPVKAGEFALSTLIYEKIILLYAKEKNAIPTDAQVTAYLPFAKKYAQAPQFTLMMADPFRSDEDFRRDAKIALIRRKLSMDPLKITDADLKKWYDANKAALTSQDEYHLRVIDVLSMDKAKKALEAIGKLPFETVALTQSEELSSKAKGGDIGTIPQPNVPVKILEAVKDLKPGEYSKTIITLSASEVTGQAAQLNATAPHYVLVQLVEKKPGVLPPFEEVRPLAEIQVLGMKDQTAFQKIAQDIETFKDKQLPNITVQLKGYEHIMDKKPAPAQGSAPTGAAAPPQSGNP